MRVACIDIGSNTTRLLVADVVAGQVRPVVEERVFTRMGVGLAARGELASEKVAEIAAVVVAQLAAARAAGAREQRVVGTAALRLARNGAELCDAVRVGGGAPVEVLEGEEEARLAFAGATAGCEAGPGCVAVVDVGGGSSEVALGRVGGGVTWWRSLPLGSSRLAEGLAVADPPSAATLELMRDGVDRALAELGDPPACGRALAVGGSATSLRRLVGPVLDAATLGLACDAVVAAPSGEVGEKLGLDPARVRLLPAGLLILEGVSLRLGRPLEVARGGLREGICLGLARGDGPSRVDHEPGAATE